MLTNDLFNTDYERRLQEGAVDRLEQRRIDDLNMKMDELANRAKSTSNPEHKKSLLKAFLNAKEERDSYYKLRTNEGSMKRQMEADAERMSREKFCDLYGDEHGEFWDNINLNEAGIGQDIVNKTEKMARATPPTRAGAVASTVKNAAKWLAGKGGPGKEGPTYEQEELDEKLKGLPSKKLGSARDIGKSVKKFRAQRGLEEAGTDSQWSKEGDWKKIPKAKSGKPADPRGEVTHLSDVARREAERKATQKKNSKEVAEHGGGIGPKQHWQDLMPEGYQDFNKVEPYAVCLAGKPVKKFDYYEQARRFHDNWKQKLYREGDKAKADKITLMPLNLDEALRDPWKEKHFGPGEVVQKIFKVKADNGKSYNIKAATEQQARETLQKHAPDANILSIKFVSNVMNEAGDRVDPILYKALDRMQPGIAGQGQPGDDLFSAARTALATEWGLMALRSEYATATAYTRQLIDLYLAKHGVKEEKTRLDPKCWKGKKIGNPKTKMKGGVRVNNCVPAEESYTGVMESQGVTDPKLLEVARRIDAFAKNIK